MTEHEWNTTTDIGPLPDALMSSTRTSWIKRRIAERSQNGSVDIASICGQNGPTSRLTVPPHDHTPSRQLPPVSSIAFAKATWIDDPTSTRAIAVNSICFCADIYPFDKDYLVKRDSKPRWSYVFSWLCNGPGKSPLWVVGWRALLLLSARSIEAVHGPREVKSCKNCSCVYFMCKNQSDKNNHRAAPSRRKQGDSFSTCLYLRAFCFHMKLICPDSRPATDPAHVSSTSKRLVCGRPLYEADRLRADSECDEPARPDRAGA